MIPGMVGPRSRATPPGPRRLTALARRLEVAVGQAHRAQGALEGELLLARPFLALPTEGHWRRRLATWAATHELHALRLRRLAALLADAGRLALPRTGTDR
jgi:hypothetical protein